MNKTQGVLKLWETYLKFTSQPGVISFASARPSNQAYQISFQRIKKIIKRLIKIKKDSLFDYSPPEGIDSFRKAIANFHSWSKPAISYKNIIVTSGGQQAIDIACRTFLQPKDRIILQNANYIGIQQSIKNRKAKIINICASIEKTSFSSLEKMIKKNKPKLFYIIPDNANPTGETLSLQKRKEIAILAKKYNFLILEDQTYKNLTFKNNPQLISFKKFCPQNTIIVNTISKIIVPGLRIGWLATPSKFFENLLTQKKSSDIFTSTFSQEIISEFIKDQKSFQNHLENIQCHYENKLSILLNSLNKYMPKGFFWNKPRGGFLLWIKGPKNFNSKKFFIKALKNKVSFMPGFVFNYQNPQYDSFRLSVSNVKEGEIIEGIKRLVKSLII
jgi:2-aminoadipate transaminase